MNQSRHSLFQLFLQKIRPWVRMEEVIGIPFIFHWVILKMTSRKSDPYYSHLTTYSLNYFAGHGSRKNWLKTDQSGVASSARVISQQMKSERREPRKNESKLNVECVIPRSHAPPRPIDFCWHHELRKCGGHFRAPIGILRYLSIFGIWGIRKFRLVEI